MTLFLVVTRAKFKVLNNIIIIGSVMSGTLE